MAHRSPRKDRSPPYPVGPATTKLTSPASWIPHKLRHSPPLKVPAAEPSPKISSFIPRDRDQRTFSLIHPACRRFFHYQMLSCWQERKQASISAVTRRIAGCPRPRRPRRAEALCLAVAADSPFWTVAPVRWRGLVKSPDHLYLVGCQGVTEELRITLNLRKASDRYAITYPFREDGVGIRIPERTWSSCRTG